MKRIVSAFLSLVFVLFSCTDLSEVEQRLDKLEGEISNINSAIEALREYSNSGKIVTDVQPSLQPEDSWKITF